jgi:glucuronate isomerase
LLPDDIASNRQFGNLAEIWLAGDHYKWRAMRANGVAESLCTGDAPPYEKFLAWARTVPHTLRNPLYHWTHMELKRYFGINELLNEDTAPRIWEQANKQLQGDDLTTQGILKKFHVRAVCTTDDPTDDLLDHRTVAENNLATKVYPTFRPDAAMRINEPAEFQAWLGKLQQLTGMEIGSFDGLLTALEKRHDFFHEMGCRLSDHGLETCYADPCTDATAGEIFADVLSGKEISPERNSQYASCLMMHFGRWDAERGWTKQLHLGALRNNNTRLMRELGRDIGCDSIGDWPQAEKLSTYLNRLQQENSLPKTIIYNLNPADNYAVATMIGNFQSGDCAGKIQMGSGWWFLDQWEGMQWQLNALSNQGLLSRFVGMLTDSRSFMSYPRHEYFRRCLCNLLGTEVEQGVLPNDDSLLGPMIRNICFDNARDYLGLEL